MSEEWQRSFQEEIERALQSRAKGNEGRARVCARRAVKYIIAEYMRRKNIHANTQSAYGFIQFFTTLTALSSEVREVAQHFLVKATPNGSLPIDIDLIAEALWLCKKLLGKEYSHSYKGLPCDNNRFC